MVAPPLPLAALKHAPASGRRNSASRCCQFTAAVVYASICVTLFLVVDFNLAGDRKDMHYWYALGAFCIMLTPIFCLMSLRGTGSRPGLSLAQTAAAFLLGCVIFALAATYNFQQGPVATAALVGANVLVLIIVLYWVYDRLVGADNIKLG